VMSSACHFLSGRVLHHRFRVTVNNIVTMTVAFNRQTLPFHTDFPIAGTNCLLSTNSHEVLQTAANWRRSETHSGTPSFRMEIIVDPSLNRAPERHAYFRGLGHIVFAMLPPRSFIAYDLLRRRVHGAISISAARDHSFWNSLLLPITIGVLGTTVGIAPIHCACLERNGSGFLLAGASGAGKSTLAAALAQLGFPFISDDWTYVSRQQCGLIANGLSSPLKLLTDAARFFPDLLALAPRTALNGELAYEIDPAKWTGVVSKTVCRPRRIFFLERTSSHGSQLVPCRPEYVRGFFEKNAERLPEELVESKAFRSRIIQALSTCPSWILRTGESPQITARALDNFLAEADRATA
jgi:hypothetical protein